MLTFLNILFFFFSDANSTEFNPHTMNPVVVDMPEHNGGNMGGTMRLGKRRTEFNTEDSILSKFYTVMTYTITRCTEKIFKFILIMPFSAHTCLLFSTYYGKAPVSYL